MSTKQVYLGGPITGLSYDETMSWRDHFTRLLSPGIVGVSPMRLKEFLANEKKIGHSYPEHAIMGAANAICARDYYDCTHADAVLCYMPKWSNDRWPSVGTLTEFGWATGHGIPTIVVSDDTRITGHPLIVGKAAWLLPSLEDGAAAINALLGVYAGQEAA